MSTARTQTPRTKKGTFQKGSSGNPSGRPKTENTLLRQKLASHGEKVAEVVIAAALQGDIQAAKIVLERVCPALKPTELGVSLALPPGSLADQGRAVLAAVGGGDLPPGQGAQLLTAIATLARVVEVDDLERRLAVLEGQHEAP